MNHQAEVRIREGTNGKYEAYVWDSEQGTGPDLKFELGYEDTIDLKVSTIDHPRATATFHYVNISNHKHNAGEGVVTIPNMKSNNRSDQQGRPAGPPGWWGGEEDCVRVEYEKPPLNSDNWCEIYQILPGENKDTHCKIKDTEPLLPTQCERYWFWGEVKFVLDGIQHNLIFDPEVVNKGTSNR